MMKKSYLIKFTLLAFAILLIVIISAAKEIRSGSLPIPTTLNDFFLFGSQPLQSGTFSNPDQCSNCHGGYDQTVEPHYNWQGSMMAQAQRDPLYLACLAVSNQDAPDVGDLCIRCHTPKGWLEGRSTPTDGSALTADDREGITCHFCHKMIAPTQIGVNPYPEDALYTTPSGSSTYDIDQAYLALIDTTIPPANANGMYICDNNDNRRGPFYDPKANHSVPYSSYHPDSKLCGTCHDVSNPVYETIRNGNGDILGYAPGAFDSVPISQYPYDMFPIERTYSEWLVSEYNTPDGVTGTYFGGNRDTVSTCQDCHMRDVTGKGCNKSYAPTRNDLPLHDLTGANTFMPDIIDSVYPGEANVAALQSGKLRALDMLQHAATVELAVSQLEQTASVKITNETGHKLPSGYPEGRRIWISLKAYGGYTGQSFESGAYDTTTGVLSTSGAKIYEIKPGLSPGIAAITGLTAGVSFHFVLNDTIYKDNRIPPRGFTNANFDSIQSPPVDYTYADGQYWDSTVYQLPFVPDSVNATLYYQTTSKEYVEFLRDNDSTSPLINGKHAGQLMYDLWNNNGKSAPEVMNNETWAIATNYWTGTLSNDWDNGGNWASGIVPAIDETAIITDSPLFFPTITSPSATCFNLIIQDGSELTVNPGAELTVNGNVILKEGSTTRTALTVYGHMRIVGNK